MLLRAPAKLNLTLEVLDRRDDGYHRVRSVMAPIAIWDEIEITPADGDPAFACEPAALEIPGNLVIRALDAAGIERGSLRVHLRKGIPTGAGLGGGSSDAAAILAAARDGALRAHAAAPWPEVARSLGSDVPFFLAGGPALVEGTGERVTPAGAAPPWWAVVVMPPAEVATAEAYGLLDRAREGHARKRGDRAQSRSIRALEALQRREFAALSDLLENDFQEPIAHAYPAVECAAAALSRIAGRRALLTGSGAALYALFEEEAAARAAAGRWDLANGCLFVAPFTDDGSWR
ncbi:MAG: 4-(cytidine 5'-diphospho)-2-C-methyl-D-erythritol kinase [bacterium]|nr:4-(cytidine 5'-diphospho)-2-C-methyl-D-erythritol kinase [bacterium]